MANTTITDLPNATTPLSGTERVPMDQSGATKDASTADIAALARNNSENSAASTPAQSITGSFFTGGDPTTTKPHVLIEPAGTTSTGWSTNGTGLGVNAASGFAGNLLDLQVDGTSLFKATAGNEARLSIRGTGSVGSIYCGNTAIFTFYDPALYGSQPVRLNGVGIAFSPSADLALLRDDANILAQRNVTNAQTYRLYNTYTDASNYERHSHSWSGNVLNIANEAAGTGTLRGIAFSQNGAASTPPAAFTGTWFTGGDPITTKPQLLIEPTGTTSTAWSTSGTGLGVNAASGFTGNLLDLQVNGTSQASVSSAGVVQGSTLKVGADSGKGLITYSSNTVTINAYGAANFQVSPSGWINPAWTSGVPWVLGNNSTETGNLNRAGSPIRLQPKGGSGNGSAAYLQLYTGLSTTSGTDGHTSELCVQTILPTTGMPGLAFGGVTSSFPALKRNSAVLETKLADDSAYAEHAASVFQAATAHTVSGLPGTPVVGQIARVTDATAPAVGSTVAGGGAAAALVWYNGTNWTVIGV